MSFVIGYLLGVLGLAAYCYDLHRRLKILQLENAELQRVNGALLGIEGAAPASAAVTRNPLKGYRVTYNHFTGATEIVTTE